MQERRSDFWGEKRASLKNDLEGERKVRNPGFIPSPNWLRLVRIIIAGVFYVDLYGRFRRAHTSELRPKEQVREIQREILGERESEKSKPSLERQRMGEEYRETGSRGGEKHLERFWEKTLEARTCLSPALLTGIVLHEQC